MPTHLFPRLFPQNIRNFALRQYAYLRLLVNDAVGGALDPVSTRRCSLCYRAHGSFVFPTYERVDKVLIGFISQG
jgi:hypothetical protein